MRGSRSSPPWRPGISNGWSAASPRAGRTMSGWRWPGWRISPACARRPRPGSARCRPSGSTRLAPTPRRTRRPPCSCSTGPICSPATSPRSRISPRRLAERGIRTVGLYVGSLKDPETAPWVARRPARDRTRHRAQRDRVLRPPRRGGIAAGCGRRPGAPAHAGRVVARRLGILRARPLAVRPRHAGGAAGARRQAVRDGDLVQVGGRARRPAGICPHRPRPGRGRNRARGGAGRAVGPARPPSARRPPGGDGALRLPRRRAARPRHRARHRRERRRDRRPHGRGRATA